MPKTTQPVVIQTRVHLLTKWGKSANVWVSDVARPKKAA